MRCFAPSWYATRLHAGGVAFPRQNLPSGTYRLPHFKYAVEFVPSSELWGHRHQRARLRPGFFYRNRSSPVMGARLMQPSLGQTRNGSIPQLRDVLRGERSFGARRPAAVARRGFVERVRAAALDSICRSRAGHTASQSSAWARLLRRAETSTIMPSTRF